jgi:hypothetical protein
VIVLLAWALAAAVAAPASAASISVHMDENTVVDLRAPAGNVLVGNPSIADVNLINPRRMVILGRSYGLTNIIVTDQMGRTIFQREVNVAAAPAGRVSLYRGPQVHNYACAPHCERTPMSGEDKTNYDPYGSPYKDYDDRAKNDSGGQAGAPAGSP